MPEGIASKRRYVTIIKMTVFWCKGQKHSRVCDMMGQVYLYSNITRNIHNTRLVSIILYVRLVRKQFLFCLFSEIFTSENIAALKWKKYIYPTWNFVFAERKTNWTIFIFFLAHTFFSPVCAYSHETGYYCDFVKMYVYSFEFILT